MRKDGFYKVVYKGVLRTAKYVTNQDHDSSWCCWWIEGEEPKAWGWSDEEFDEIFEEGFEKRNLLEEMSKYQKFYDACLSKIISILDDESRKDK